MITNVLNSSNAVYYLLVGGGFVLGKKLGTVGLNYGSSGEQGVVKDWLEVWWDCFVGFDFGCEILKGRESFLGLFYV